MASSGLTRAGNGNTIFAYTIFVKNITFSADENLIDQARRTAAERHTTLNDMFRDWLQEVSGREKWQRDFDELMEQLKHFSVDRKYTREEMNER
jgi:hypothetical protein